VVGSNPQPDQSVGRQQAFVDVHLDDETLPA
jgi:hypothetical protein